MRKPWARRTSSIPARRGRAGLGPYNRVCDPKAVAGPMITHGPIPIPGPVAMVASVYSVYVSIFAT